MGKRWNRWKEKSCHTPNKVQVPKARKMWGTYIHQEKKSRDEREPRKGRAGPWYRTGGGEKLKSNGANSYVLGNGPIPLEKKAASMMTCSETQKRKKEHRKGHEAGRSNQQREGNHGTTERTRETKKKKKRTIPIRGDEGGVHGARGKRHPWVGQRGHNEGGGRPKLKNRGIKDAQRGRKRGPRGSTQHQEPRRRVTSPG